MHARARGAQSTNPAAAIYDLTALDGTEVLSSFMRTRLIQAEGANHAHRTDQSAKHPSPAQRCQNAEVPREDQLHNRHFVAFCSTVRTISRFAPLFSIMYTSH